VTAVARTRSRNRRGAGRLLHAEIVAAAAELLDVSGDERAITLRGVARRLGIAAPSIYPHFPDRSAVVLAVARQGFAELSDGMGSAVDTAGADPRRRLAAACRAHLVFADRHRARYRVMAGVIHDPAAAEPPRILTEILAGCVAAGRSTSTDPAADAMSLWVGLHGLAHQRAVTASYPWPADIVHRITAPLSRLA
jgi:AcrR family transcriptional regulator